MFTFFHYLLPHFIVNFFTHSNNIHQLTSQAGYDFCIPNVHLNVNENLKNVLNILDLGKGQNCLTI